MNFGELKPGDTLYLIDYNQFKKDLTYIKGVVQNIVSNDNTSNDMYKALINNNNIIPKSITITGLFNGIQFPFSVTNDMSIAKANDRTICITKEDVLQEIRIRKNDADNQIQSLNRYKDILEQCEKVEAELLGDTVETVSNTNSRIDALETKLNDLINLISNGKYKETIEGVGESSNT